jgi:chromosome segregation ATPase
MFDYYTLLNVKYDKIESENEALTKENDRLKQQNEELKKDIQKMYDIFTATEDARSKAMDEVFSLQDALDMKQVSNDAIDKEAHALRAEVKELERLNTAAINRCAEKQRRLNQLTEHNKKELKDAKITVDILRADCCTLRQKLYVQQYPSEDKELDQFKAMLKEAGLKLIELAE